MPIQTGIGLSTDKDIVKAANIAAREAMLGLYAQKIHIAFVFSSVEFARPDILALISNITQAATLIGSSSLAVMSQRGIYRHAIAVAVLSLPKNIFFNAACVRNLTPGNTAAGSDELGEKLLYGFQNVRRDFALIFSDGLMHDGSNLLFGLQARLGTSFPITGASASDELTFQKTYVYFNKEVLTGAAAGILWGGKLDFGIGSKHGWNAIGKPRRVTRSDNNIVYEIDGMPAANIYKDYFGCDLAKLNKELRRVSILYPIGIYLSKEEEYLLRNILYIREDGAIVFQGNVPQESMVKLMIGTEESCLAATKQVFGEMRINRFSLPVSLAFVFDSASRYILLGRKAPKELEIIKENLAKDTPIIGMYTYGEQAPLKNIDYQGRAYFHNQTVTVVTIGG